MLNTLTVCRCKVKTAFSLFSVFWDKVTSRMMGQGHNMSLTTDEFTAWKLNIKCSFHIKAFKEIVHCPQYEFLQIITILDNTYSQHGKWNWWVDTLKSVFSRPLYSQKCNASIVAVYITHMYILDTVLKSIWVFAFVCNDLVFCF